MNGFFSSTETQSTSRPGGKIASCASCGLLRQATSPKMEPVGEFKKNILLILPYPTETEDKRDEPLSGEGGRLLKQAFSKLGIDVMEDCLVTYALRCRPDSPDNITGVQTHCCRRFLMEVIKEYSPTVIIPFGVLSIEALIGHRFSLGEIESVVKWRGWTIPDQELKAWVCPVFDPTFVLQAKGPATATIWNQDIEQAVQCVTKKFRRHRKATIDVIEDLSVLSEIQSDLCAFDYETTGIKPHAPGHRIVCASIADTNNHAYVFMMPLTKRKRQPFVDFLKNPQISKVAQNMKFEENWSFTRLQTPVAGWIWDTMIGTHCIDNRPGVTGLKFQTYVTFGVIDYSSHVSPYLKAEGSNQVNKVLEMVNDPLLRQDLLHYCAWDSLFERRLFEYQVHLLNYDFLPF